MQRFVGRLVVAMAVALAPLALLAPPAAAAQQVVIHFYFDLDGDGSKDAGEGSRPPSSMHPNVAGWLVRVWFYKVDDNDRILAETWENVALNGSSTTLSRRLSPGRWVAVLGQVDHGDFDQAPASWGDGSRLTQTEPSGHQSVELTITEEGADQPVRFGYGPSDRNFAAAPGALTGPAFGVRSDENYNQVADAGEPSIPDGIEFTLRPAHLRHDVSHTTTSSNGVVSFPFPQWWGAKVVSVAHGSAAPPPYYYAGYGYSESGSSTVSYLVHEDVNDDCDQDPGDDTQSMCFAWPLPHERPALAVLPAVTPVAGTVFVDSNANGVRDAGEGAPTVPDLRLEFAPRDGHSPGTFFWDGDSAVGADGRFDLGPVPKGTYALQTNLSPWQVTTDPIEVPTTGASLGPLEVGITSTFVSGRLYVDKDADGAYDTGEETLPGVTLRTWNETGEVVEMLDEDITDARGRFRLQVDPDDPQVEIVDDLTEEFDHPYRLSVPLTSHGEASYDLPVHPVGRPDEVWPARQRIDGGVRKLWWQAPEDVGDAPLKGYVIRTWDHSGSGLPVAGPAEKCVSATSTYAALPVAPGRADDLVTVQAVNARGAGLPNWVDGAEPGTPEGPAPVEVDCATLLGDSTLTAPAKPAKPRAVKARAKRRAVLVRWKPGKVTASHGTASRYLAQRKVGKKWRTVAKKSAKARKHKVRKLPPRKVVRLRVVAVNAEGRTPSSTVRARPKK